MKSSEWAHQYPSVVDANWPCLLSSRRRGCHGLMIPRQMYLLVISLLFSGLPILAQNAGERCYSTVDGNSGRCVDIRQCSKYLKLLQGPRPLPTETVDFLRKVQCGFQGRNPLVCCPQESRPTPPPFTKPDTESDEVESGRPVDVSRHPALKLLPRICGPVADNKITGGNVTDLYEYPWMALLGYVSDDSDEIQYRCGGSVINERYVLTAAHCVTYLHNNLELVRVRLGEYDLSTEQDCLMDLGCAPRVLDFSIERIIPHPDYTKTELTHDIALIRLRGKARFSRSVFPICLPVGREQRKTLVNEKATVTGWGYTEQGTTSNVLLKIDLPIVPRSQCAAIYNRAVPVTEQQMCAGGLSGKDSCGGDSGGPLQFVGQTLHGGLGYIQYGIVSFGPRQCGSAGRPGVYTRVGFYMDWILDNMRP